jgi:hypothetical protein
MLGKGRRARERRRDHIENVQGLVVVFGDETHRQPARGGIEKLGTDSGLFPHGEGLESYGLRDGGREGKAEQREARAKDKVFNAFHKVAAMAAPVTGSCGGLCGEDRDFNASCQRRMCRQYFAGWAGRLIL